MQVLDLRVLCMHVYVCMYIHTYVYVCVYVCTCMYFFICLRKCVCMFVCLYIELITEHSIYLSAFIWRLTFVCTCINTFNMSKVSTVFHQWCFMLFIASNNIIELKDKITETVLFIILITTSETLQIILCTLL